MAKLKRIFVFNNAQEQTLKNQRTFRNPMAMVAKRDLQLTL